MPLRIHREPGRVKKIDWVFFWVVEVLLLSSPLFIIVFTLPRDSRLEFHQTVGLAGIQLGLTVLNISWALIHTKYPVSQKGKGRL